MLLIEEVAQFLSVLVWGFSGGNDGILHSGSWMLFSFIALGRLMHDVGTLCLTMAYLSFVPGEYALTGSGDIFNWTAIPGHVLSCYLFWTGWTTAIAEHVQDNDDYLFWLGTAVVWKFAAIVNRLHTTSVIGQLLIPIRDVFREPLIVAMLVVLVATVMVVMAFVFIVWKGGSASQLKSAAVNTWVNIVIGEPVMLMGEDPDEFDYSWSQYVIISGVQFAFAIMLLNVLMAMTMETYKEISRKVRGRLLRTQAEMCRVTMWKRRVLLTVFCNWLGLNANKALFLIFSSLVVSTAAVLLVTEVRLLTTLLIYGGAAETVLTLFVLLLGTPIKPANAGAEDKWWIEQNYLWVCTPRKEATRSDGWGGGHVEELETAKRVGGTTSKLECPNDDAEFDGGATPRPSTTPRRGIAGIALEQTLRPESPLPFHRGRPMPTPRESERTDVGAHTSSEVMEALRMLQQQVGDLSRQLRRDGAEPDPGV